MQEGGAGHEQGVGGGPESTSRRPEPGAPGVPAVHDVSRDAADRRLPTGTAAEGLEPAWAGDGGFPAVGAIWSEIYPAVQA